MNIYRITFSPTGGTQRAADCLAEAVGQSTLIDLMTPAGAFSIPVLTADDLCIVSVPSFAGRIPPTATERIRRFKGNGAKAVAVVAYGNRAYDDTLLELKNVLEELDFQVIAAIGAVAEHSILHQFAAGRPDAEDLAELTVFGGKIKNLLSAGSFSKSLTVPGNEEYRPLPAGGAKPSIREGCTGCGTCAAQCPVGAIPKDAPATTDAAACISCMRCISVCPTHARHLDEALLAGLTQRIGPALSGRKPNELFL